VVTAPFDGDVRSVDVRAGEQVASGTVLVTLETA
jgi:biotin carboxyl carrier protein